MQQIDTPKVFSVRLPNLATVNAHASTLNGAHSSRILRRSRRAYLNQLVRLWNHWPEQFRVSPVGRAFGSHLHSVVQANADRRQYFGTFFLRNRAELELMNRLVNQKPHGEELRISIVACSKGAEVYSIMWALRSARPDLKIRMHAVDISSEILEFAEKGIYSRFSGAHQEALNGQRSLDWNTAQDQNAPIFERMTEEELQAIADLAGDEVRIRPSIKKGITWIQGDAASPELVAVLGLQDLVVANRFLCHMMPVDAEKCLRNLVRLVKPGGYLFISGIDLEVRLKVAADLGWKPVTELMKEVYEGDSSLAKGWPLEYWGLEPFSAQRTDWKMRYASVFQIGQVLETFQDSRAGSQFRD